MQSKVAHMPYLVLGCEPDFVTSFERNLVVALSRKVKLCKSDKVLVPAVGPTIRILKYKYISS